ncbi:MAG: hypothetical protein IKE76_12230, partial [Clostridia bacterium]|nr:hypothetical protein [Clostridia bacterium]
MKRNHRKNRIWLSILLIIALMTPMISGFALAEGEDNGLEMDVPQPVDPEVQAAIDAAAAQAAAQAAAEAQAIAEAQAAAEAAAAQ